MARVPTAAARRTTPTGPGAVRLEECLREQQRRLAAASAALGAAGSDDVHAARVAARRLRSMLRTFRPLLDEPRSRRYRDRLRTFARSLGAARESDVRRALLLDLARRDPALGPQERRRLIMLLDDGCLAAREQLRRHLAEPQWQALGRSLGRGAAGGASVVARDATIADLTQLAARTWRRPLKLLRAGPSSTPELHALRLAFKHCRYALEPVTDVSPRAASRLLRRLRAAQDRIGEHRDVLLAEHWVRENERALGRPLVARLVAQLQKREKSLRRQSAGRAGKVLEAWRSWRDATRRLRKGASRGRG